MALWGNLDNATGNQKPQFANTSNATSGSTINGTVANTDQYYGLVMGVSATEEERSNGTAQHPSHAGWVAIKFGTGPLVSAAIANPGQGINAAGYIVVTDTATDTTSGATGSGINISFTIANTQNTLQAYSTNAYWNGVATLTINSFGSGYSNVSRITAVVSNAAKITQPTITLTLGGKAGRIMTETLVAMGSITGDDPADNAYFTGI